MEKQLIKIELSHSVYAFYVDDTKRVIHLGFGKEPKDIFLSDVHYDRGFSGQPYEKRFDRTYSLDTKYLEYSSNGVGDFRPSSLEITYADGTKAFDPLYQSFKLYTSEEELKNREKDLYGELTPHFRSPDKACDLTLSDPITHIEVTLHYDFFCKYDLVQRSVTITNKSNEVVSIDKISSLTLDIPQKNDKDYIHLYGHQAGERYCERCKAPYSDVLLSSKRGMSSHHENPSLILCDSDANEDSGQCYLFSMVYSGDFFLECFREAQGGYRVNCGLNPETFKAHLQPGESFNTPCAIVCYSPTGLTDLSLNMHDAIKERLVPFIPSKAPVLLNSWEGVYMNFNQEKLVEMAKGAKKMGCDLFVVDDGWFGKRDDDTSSLGDWDVDTRKLPEGLQGLKAAIDKLGLNLGLWVEPEMISENSELYRAHPDWAIKIPNRNPNVSRSQLVIDMTRKDVRDYLFSKIDKAVTDSGISYLKWDFNRSVTNLYSPDKENLSRFSYNFIMGTYDLLHRILAKHPGLLLETCAGGGGRFDLGMLYFTPQIWGSDDTDCYDRGRIEYGTSFFYPPFTMGAHVSKSPNPGTNRPSTLMQRFETALIGTYGYELDPKVLTEEEIEKCDELSAKFRKVSAFMRQSDFLRLSDSNKDPVFAYEFLSKDKKTAFIGASDLKDVNNNLVYPRRLLADKNYTDGSNVKSGEAWMKEGVEIKGLTAADKAGDMTLKIVE